MAKFLSKKLIGISGLLGGSIYFHEDIKRTSVGCLRFGRAAYTVLGITWDYHRTLYSSPDIVKSNDYLNIKSQVHKRGAEKLLELCCHNGGSFIKVGQHLGSLDYLLPSEYVDTLKILHSKAPQSSLDDIYDVIKLELHKEIDDIFDQFDPEPLGAASLAQVHKATLKDGSTVAVKVQHPPVLDHSFIDMKGMEVLVKCVSLLFPDFQFDWLVKEMKRNLPLELDFTCEAKNAEKVAKTFAHLPWLKVPMINWNLTTERVLVMEFCEGGQINDLCYIKNHNINAFEVSDKLGTLYSEMIFVNGYIHCDPHPGNVLVNKIGNKTDIVLLDHGLYLDLTEDFRLTYGELWQSILNADVDRISTLSQQLGVGDLYNLFTCMVTGRSWKSISKGIDKNRKTSDEVAEIKDDAAKYLPQIAEVLTRVPREMLLIFKTNDLLRGIEHSLNTSANMKSFISMSRCCIRAVYDHKRKLCSSRWSIFWCNFQERYAMFRITMYSFYLWIVNFH